MSDSTPSTTSAFDLTDVPPAIATVIDDYLVSRAVGDPTTKQAGAYVANAAPVLRNWAIHMADTHGITDLTDLEPVHMRRYARHLKTNVRTETYTAATAHTYYGYIRAFLAWCVRDQYLTSNPAADDRATEELPAKTQLQAGGDTTPDQQFWAVPEREAFETYLRVRAVPAYTAAVAFRGAEPADPAEQVAAIHEAVTAITEFVTAAPTWAHLSLLDDVVTAFTAAPREFAMAVTELCRACDAGSLATTMSRLANTRAPAEAVTASAPAVASLPGLLTAAPPVARARTAVEDMADPPADPPGEIAPQTHAAVTALHDAIGADTPPAWWTRSDAVEQAGLTVGDAQAAVEATDVRVSQSTLAGALYPAVAAGALAAPADAVSPPGNDPATASAVVEAAPRTVTEPIIPAAIDVAPIRDYALVLVLAYTGVRGAEIAREKRDSRRDGLRWSDVDVEAGAIRVLGKSQKYEHAPLPAPAARALRRYRAVVQPPAESFPVFPTHHAPTRYAAVRDHLHDVTDWSADRVTAVVDAWPIEVLVRLFDVPVPAVSTEGVRSILSRLTAGAGVDVDGDEYLKPHGARRGLGDELYREQPTAAQQALRHASIDITNQRYSHIGAGETAATIEAVREVGEGAGDEETASGEGGADTTTGVDGEPESDGW